MDYLSWLFNLPVMMQSWRNDAGTSNLVWLFRISELLVGLASLTMAALLAFFLHRRNVPFPWILRLFAAFFVASGLLHLLEVAFMDRLLVAIRILLVVACWALVAALAWLLVRRPSQVLAGNTKERGRTWEALRLKEQQFRLMVEGVTDYAIYMLRPDGVIASWNAEARRIKGYRAEEIIGHHFSRFYTPEDVQRGKPAMELSVAATQGRYEEEGWRVRKEGSRFWANVVITALRDEAGQLQGFVKVTRDMTERKEREEMLRQLHRDLEQRVVERTAALAAANEALASEIAERKKAEEGLQQAAVRKDEFLAMLAHELRNPLAPIRNGLHILQIQGTDPEMKTRARDMIERQVCHLTKIVDDLVDVSRIQRGKVVLQAERLDLVRLLRVAVEDQGAFFEKAGLDVTLDVPEVPVWIHGDVTRLTQVVGNLLQNAGKFTERGGRVTVGLQVDALQHQAKLVVRDTGMGIAPDLLPHLFEVFAQGDRSLDRSKGGLGLGLALIKGLTELHGGQVQAFSKGPGQGAEFVVWLPVEAEPMALTNMTAEPRPGKKRLRILVVEDNLDSAESLRMLLELFGHEVTVANTGPAGVQTAVEIRPNVILCDIGLPGLDGYGVVRSLRRNPVTAEAHMIAVTGYGAAEDRRKSREAGFELHLMKPVVPEVLQDVIGSF